MEDRIDIDLIEFYANQSAAAIVLKELRYPDSEFSLTPEMQERAAIYFEGLKNRLKIVAQAVIEGDSKNFSREKLDKLGGEVERLRASSIRNTGHTNLQQ